VQDDQSSSQHNQHLEHLPEGWDGDDIMTATWISVSPILGTGGVSRGDGNK